MIPKTIHYCWFGEKPLPELAKKCIESWKKYCPDYEIIRWDETNYDVHKNQFVEQAYQNSKWAFLTDYVRLDVVYEMGGIYLDTDVELIKPLDSLLELQCYMGMEQPGRVNTGLGFGAEKHHPFILENKRVYEDNNFSQSEGKFKPPVCVEITTNLFDQDEIKNASRIQNARSVTVFPTEYFCPQAMGSNRINITKNTFSIHYFTASWKSKPDMLMFKIGLIIKRIFGDQFYGRIAEIKHKIIG